MTNETPGDAAFVDDAHRAFNMLGKHMLLGRLGVLLEATQEIAYSFVSETYRLSALDGAGGLME